MLFGSVLAYEMGQDKMDAEPAAPAAAAAPQPAPAPPALSPLGSLRALVQLLEAAVKAKETRLTGRVLRAAAAIRAHLTGPLLADFFSSSLADDVGSREYLVAQARAVRGVAGAHACAHGGAGRGARTPMQRPFDRARAAPQAPAGAPAAMDTDEASSSAPQQQPGNDGVAKPSSTPEVELCCFMLLLMHLIDQKKPEQARGMARWGPHGAGCGAARCGARAAAAAACMRIAPAHQCPHAQHPRARTRLHPCRPRAWP